MTSRRLGIVGCGAVTRLFHLPASQLTSEFEVAALTDTDRQTAISLAQEYAIPTVVNSYRELTGLVDLVLVATPPHSHVEIVCSLLSDGMSVLCEKPLGRTAAECQQMISAARASGAVLLAGHNRRFFTNRRLLRQLLMARAFGDLREISLTAGGEFAWPSATAYMFDRDTAAGGVMLDSGIHELDTLLWYWPDLRIEDYADDSLGGLESNLALRFIVEDNVPGMLRLSRTSPLANRLRITGSNGRAELVTYETSQLTIDISGATLSGPPWTVETLEHLGLIETYAAQVAAAFMSLEGADTEIATAEEALRVATVIDTCYALKGARRLPSRLPPSGVPS